VKARRSCHKAKNSLASVQLNGTSTFLFPEDMGNGSRVQHVRYSISQTTERGSKKNHNFPLLITHTRPSPVLWYRLPTAEVPLPLCSRSTGLFVWGALFDEKSGLYIYIYIYKQAHSSIHVHWPTPTNGHYVVSYFAVGSICHNTGCFKKSFTTLKARTNLLRGHV
jgi:hypothetical protein